MPDALRGLRSAAASAVSSSGGSGSAPVAVGAWQQVNGIWKYLKPDGTYAANGWEQINQKWYYFDGNANMLANQWIPSAANPHIRYYVGQGGDMLVDQYVDGRYVNAQGENYV